MKSLANLRSKAESVLSFLFLFITVISCSYFLFWICNFVLTHQIPFDIDEADHANPALELYVALTRHDLTHLWSAFTAQAFYPPLHSIFVCAAYWLGGVTVQSSRLVSVALFGAYLSGVSALSYFAAKSYMQRAEGSSGIDPYNAARIAAAIALLFASSSVITISSSVLCMLELAGIFTTTVLMLWLADRKELKICARDIFGAAGCVLLIFFTKYSFGLFALPAMLCAAFFSPAMFRSISEIKLRLKIVLTILALVLAGLGVWVSITNSAALWHFFVGHNSNAPLLSSENLFFDIYAWFRSYCCNPTVALLVVIFSAIAAIKLWDQISVRFAVFLPLWALLIMLLSSTNEERHIIIIAPALFYLASLGVPITATLLREKFPRQPIIHVTPLLLLIIFITLGISSQSKTLKRTLLTALEGKPEYQRLQTFIIQHVDAHLPILVQGDLDQLNVEALRWRLGAETGLGYSETKVDWYPYSLNAEYVKRDRLRMHYISELWSKPDIPREPLQAMLAANYYRYAVRIVVIGDSKARQSEVAQSFLTALQSYPHEELVVGGVRVVVYDLATA